MNTLSMSQSSQVRNQRETRSFTSARRGFLGLGSWRVVFALAAFIGLGAAGQGSAWADCPDVPAACPYLAWGWQGQCWDVAWCSDCGPAKCPSLPGIYRVLPRLADESKCPEAKSRATDGCSNKLSDPASKLYNDVFKTACDAHDVCYSIKGVPKVLCDMNFYQNMSYICRDFYQGAANAAQRFSCLSAAGIYADAVSLTPQGAKAYSDDQDWANKCCGTMGTKSDCPTYYPRP